jgi:hypothetical protein
VTNNATPVISYEFEPGKRSIFAEIYFPKKVAYQGAIFEALSNGLDEERVRIRLVKLARLLLETELSVYPHWFDPDRYTTEELNTARPTLEQAEARMKMYASPFHGWSMYEVDGVFLAKQVENGRQRIDEERTQVIRLIFVFNHDEEKAAIAAGHLDVYRAILYWVMSIYGHTDYDAYWSAGEMGRFLDRHREWKSDKRRYAEEHYKRLAGSITKWIDDCGLFIFGFLVRELWKHVVEVAEAEEDRKLEDEIWVSSIFHFNINIMKPHTESLERAIMDAAQAKEQSHE